ncbi:uncharacterized protein LOC129592448 isoform X2 [Paramacrobiotus metropolitanus]|uniref:uncharacterized protein LOC129592448 isoform X2 n=1 Tax=Paramacrobiotus metropolitanus TaxID=2943436 RepID=UPI002445C613|nr:uncharacterized protein LOC129592448 isoform X2 [Paramacrobiotus metropolitanus]
MIFMWSLFPGYIAAQVGQANIHTISVRRFIFTCLCIGTASMQCSDWVLVAFSLTRLLSVIDPFGMATRLTRCRMRIVVLCFIPLAVANNIFYMVDYATEDTRMANDTWVKNWRHLQNSDAELCR